MLESKYLANSELEPLSIAITTGSMDFSISGLSKGTAIQSKKDNMSWFRNINPHLANTKPKSMIENSFLGIILAKSNELPASRIGLEWIEK